MEQKVSALYSHYIIDGVRQNASPAELLAECSEASDRLPEKCTGDYADIIDESPEPPLAAFSSNESSVEEYLRLTSEADIPERPFPILYPESFTTLKIAEKLIDMIWREGHFRLGNLRINAEWKWDMSPVGNMSAFYKSASAASTYLYDIGVRLSDYSFSVCTSGERFIAEAWLPEKEPDTECPGDAAGTPDADNEFFCQEIPFRLPYESRHPWAGTSRKCSSRFLEDAGGMLIYIPFDTCRYRLGGSLLSWTSGHTGGQPAGIQDPDYFIDCYEVVRELVEDGIILSGATVADGGLITAAAGMLSGDGGLDLDISGLLASFREDDPVRILFGEVPGTLVQISDGNLDYFDSQLLLQDVAYYPVGRFSGSHKGICIAESARAGVADIIASLLEQTSEGED